ncbi:class I SAM-dependent methyltransferase [Marmoricola endophyticus]|uniref:class I SAM-dependent methyltransferase n=1 Tax=Marmoricola endophyticus TaxID=2040280 RepID=UPI0016636D28|nr:class I SAM-dependent methyltransferase [Marmoricola endophyticus]
MPRLTDDDVDTVPGAFWAPDLDLFRVLLEATAAQGDGDLAELGVLLGRSAVLIGDHLRPGEVFTVVDLFGDDSGDRATDAENDTSYPTLTQAAFERHYRRLHRDLPVVVRGLTSSLVDHAPHGTHRFVHVDASHLHHNVVADLEVSRTLLRPDGVLVLDDFRAEHTPGVAAAAWQAVGSSGLHAFAVSPQKMYATWGDPAPYLRALRSWLTAGGPPYETQQVNGRDLLLVSAPRATAAPHPARRFVPPVLVEPLARVRRRVRGLR